MSQSESTPLNPPQEAESTPLIPSQEAAASPPPIPLPRAVFYIDGQNLFWGAKREFGYIDANYDIPKLCTAIAALKGWQVSQMRFYTGIADPNFSWNLNQFWQNKLRSMSRRGVKTFTRKLVYRNDEIELPDGTLHNYSYAQEKGIDVRIAVDSIRGAMRGDYDVAVLVSRDQDLSEAAREIREIAKELDRSIVVASAYPYNGMGQMHCIATTVGIPIDRNTYDACLDNYNYWPQYQRRR